MKSTLICLSAIAALSDMALSAHAAQATTYYSIEEQNVQQQTGSFSKVAGYNFLAYDQFALVAKVDTGGANLSAAPILGLPPPLSSSITFPVTGTSFSPTWATGDGYLRYQYVNAWASAASLNSVFGGGTYTFILGNATVRPTLSLNTATPVFPIAPMLTSGGTWNGSTLLVDPATGTTLTFNSSSFTTYSSGLGGQIAFLIFSTDGYPNTIVTPSRSVYAPTLGKTDTALSSFTIAPGTLTYGQTYVVQANYTQLEEINTTFFTGTGISGNPVGLSYYTTSTFITVQAISGSVVEFYNANLDNYFITADAGEATAIDNGGAGPGWSRTGNSFKSGGSTSVCRFYGSQSPGPNSHFYTVDSGECNSLKQLQASTPATEKRWNFESLDFVSTPTTSSNCPAGTTPIYRAYNNGFTRGVDSNHRITSSTTAIQEVVNRGWKNEGVVMCAPQ